MSYKLDFTASGGCDEKLFGLIIGFCDRFDVCLLCKEGDGKSTHYHAHAVIETKKRSDSLRRTIKKIYVDNGYGFTHRAVYIKACVEVAGALSYVYKDKNVLLNKGYILDTIKVWSDRKPKKKTKVCSLTMGNAVDKIIDFCDAQGTSCDDFETFKEIIKEMAIAKYRVAMILKNIRPIMIDVLAHYGDTRHLCAFLDEKCNFFN